MLLPEVHDQLLLFFRDAQLSSWCISVTSELNDGMECSRVCVEWIKEKTPGSDDLWTVS